MLNLKNDWTQLPSRNEMIRQRGHKELDFPPGPEVQARWDIPELVVVGAAISGRFGRDDTTGRMSNFALDFDSFQSEAAAVIRAGASFVHIDTGGIPKIMESGLSVPEIYRRIFDGIDRQSNTDWVRDANILRGKNFAENLYPVTEGLAEIVPMAPNYPVDWMEAVATVVTERNGRVFFAVHSTAEVDLANRLVISKGLLPKPTCWCVLIGYPYDDATDRICTYLANPKAMINELMLMVDRIREIDANAFIYVCASGRAGHYLATTAMLLGLHIRVGTEDMAFRYPHKDEILDGNVETVERAAATAKALGRRLATAVEFRQMIGLPPKS